jgi:hypothetical protein
MELNETYVVSLVLISMLLLGIIIGSGATFWIFSAYDKPCTLECPECPDCILNETKCPDCIHYAYVQDDSRPQIVKIAQDLAGEASFTDEYNCDEYSWELSRRYKNLGYDSYYCEGWVDWDTCPKDYRPCKHAWVKICSYIEAVTGEFLTAEKYKSDYDSTPVCTNY